MIKAPKGPLALDPSDMKNHLDANRSEFKRRLAYAFSFASSTVGAIVPMLKLKIQSSVPKFFTPRALLAVILNFYSI